MIVRVLQSIEEFKALEPSWRVLHEHSPEASLFNDFDYAWVWWSTFSSLGKLCIYVVEDVHGKVTAIAPMYRTRTPLSRFFKVSTLRFIGRGSEVTPVDLNVLLCSDDALAGEAGDVLLSEWRRGESRSSGSVVQKILLEELPEASRFYAMCRRSLAFVVEDRQTRWVVTSLPDSWPEFLAGLSRNTRKRIKHRRNRLNDASTLTLQLCTDESSTREALSALILLHRQRRHSKGDTAAFSTESYVQFHESLLARTLRCETPGELSLEEPKQTPRWSVRFVTLRDGDDIVGVEHLYRFKDALMFNQTGFNPEYESVSPGHNMMVFAIEHAIGEGLRSVDLLLGDYPYKRSYARDSVVTVKAAYYPSVFLRTFSTLLNFARQLKNRLPRRSVQELS